VLRVNTTGGRTASRPFFELRGGQAAEPFSVVLLGMWKGKQSQFNFSAPCIARYHWRVEYIGLPRAHPRFALPCSGARVRIFVTSTRNLSLSTALSRPACWVLAADVSHDMADFDGTPTTTTAIPLRWPIVLGTGQRAGFLVQGSDSCGQRAAGTAALQGGEEPT